MRAFPMIHIHIEHRKSWAWADVLREGDWVEIDCKKEPVIRVFSSDWLLELPLHGTVLHTGKVTMDGSSFRKKMSHIKTKSTFELIGHELHQDQKSWEVEKISKKPLVAPILVTHSLASKQVWDQAWGCVGMYRPEADWHPWRKHVQLAVKNQQLTIWHTDGYSYHETVCCHPTKESFLKSIHFKTWDAATRWFLLTDQWSIGINEEFLMFHGDHAKLYILLTNDHVIEPIQLPIQNQTELTWGPVETFVAAPTKKEPDRKKPMWIRAETEWMNALRSFRDESGVTYEDIWIRFVNEDDQFVVQTSLDFHAWKIIYTQSSSYFTTYTSIPFRSHALLKGLHQFPDVQQALFSSFGLEVTHMNIDPLITSKSFWFGCFNA